MVVKAFSINSQYFWTYSYFANQSPLAGTPSYVDVTEVLLLILVGDTGIEGQIGIEENEREKEGRKHYIE